MGTKAFHNVISLPVLIHKKNGHAVSATPCQEIRVPVVYILLCVCLFVNRFSLFTGEIRKYISQSDSPVAA